jgi:hypothetical protein
VILMEGTGWKDLHATRIPNKDQYQHRAFLNYLACRSLWHVALALDSFVTRVKTGCTKSAEVH